MSDEERPSGLWDSIPRMERTVRVFGRATLVSGVVMIASWPFTLFVAVPAGIVATALVLGTLFTWFRLDHLREVERFR